jgi:hypothetical protein
MMRTKSGIVLMFLAGIAAGVPSRAAAQMSSPNYSTYNDGMNGGDGYVYGWSSVEDDVPEGCDHSNYYTTTYLTSPSGRYASLESSGTSSNVALEFDGEGGYWDVGTEGYLFCSCAGTNLEYSGESPLPLDGPPTITGGPDDVWWFNGETPTHYNNTAVTLNSSAGASTHWTVTAGSDKVTLSASDGAQTTVRPTGSVFSTSQWDITITATAAGGSANYQMTARTPDSLSPGTVSTTCDGTYGYITTLAYTVKDNLTSDMPASVEANENWPSPYYYYDFTGANWGQGDPNGFMTLGAGLTDSVSAPPLARNPAPYPTPTCDLNSTPVVHWAQAWRIGSQTIGSGRLVQTDNIQKLLGRALHTSIVSPVR